MLVRLRRELIAITMLLVGLVLAGVLGMMFYSNYTTQHDLTDEVLERALRGDRAPRFGDPTGEQNVDIMLAFVVDVSSDGTISGFGSSVMEISSDTLYDVVFQALQSPESSGESAEYPISWRRAETPGGWRVALVDTYSRDAALKAQAINSLFVFAGSMGALYVVAYLLSGLALRPVEQAWDQQRRFVSDASHELKTPLAVILANTQILEGDRTLGEEPLRWVRSTAEEAKHLKGLVEELLTLARADERGDLGHTGSERLAETSLDAIVSRCALEFDAVAFERGCTVDCQLEAGVMARVYAEDYRRVVRTLLDNATKYAEKDSVVRVTLGRDGRRSRLTVNNRGEVISPEDLAHLFDRFFRTDRARERTAEGGFGLGLAIARSLVESAGGKIFAASTVTDGTTFTVIL